MRRLSAVALVVCLAMAGCAEDAAPTKEDAAAAATAPATDVASTTDPAAQPTTNATAPAEADFGSRYNGAPVAFWFWAPY